MEVTRIKINGMYHPMGLETNHPLISWNLDGVREQKSYRICAKGSLGTVYDSGMMTGSQMYHMAEQIFQSRERVTVNVTVVTEKGTCTGQTFFEMGILPSDWKAHWILPELSVPDSKEERPASELFCSFTVEQPQNARLYITCHGIYNAYLNGCHVDGFEMAPGTSDYPKLLQYQVYDVTELLQPGENEIRVTLGNGWWRGTVTYDGIKNAFGDRVALLAQLENDGEMVCMTDDTWIATQEGPLRDTDNMTGEVYDARREIILDSMPDGWHEVTEADYGYENIHSSNCPAPKIRECLHPVLLITPKGEKVLDFGQNIAGYVSFCLEEEEGTELTLTHGETLDGDGNFTMENFQSPHFYCSQEIHYICRQGRNTYRPRNTFMGFRYVKVEGLETVLPDDFMAYAVYTDLEQTADFTCGHPLVNRLVKNALWSLKGNLLDMPTDCPTREKSGFTGDLAAYVYTMMYQMDAYPIIHKCMENLAIAQFEDGCVKQIVASPGEQNPIDGAAGWSDAFEILPDRVADRYGREDLFAEYYDAIKKWVDFMLKRAWQSTREENRSNPYHEYLEDSAFHWGEWAEPDMDFPSYMQNVWDHGEPEAGTAYLSYACHILSKHAARLGKKEDAAYYANASEMAKKAYRYAFVEEDGRILSDRMCRYIRPIVLDLLNEDEKKAAAADLNELVCRNQYRLNTGFLTTHELCRTLSDYGYVETAYRLLLNEECPGWLYSVKQGATTIPENWDAYGANGERKSSFNHYSYGAVVGWLMDTAAGIRFVDGKLILAPKPCRDLGYVSCSYLSPVGKVVSKWEYRGSDLFLSFTVPGNTTASIRLPDGRNLDVTSGEYSFLLPADS